MRGLWHRYLREGDEKAYELLKGMLSSVGGAEKIIGREILRSLDIVQTRTSTNRTYGTVSKKDRRWELIPNSSKGELLAGIRSKAL